MQDTKTVYGSTETFPWGGSETTYYVNGQVIGFSESHSDAGAAGTSAGGYSSSNETYFDKDHNRIGDSYDDGQGNSGSNFRVKLTAAVDIDGDGTDDFGAGTATATYFQETGSSSWSYQDANGQTVSQTSEYTTYYAVSSSDSNEPDWSKMLGGRDVYDGIETLWGANWTHLGQKSSVNIADAVSQGTAGYSEVTDFTGLPASFKAAAGKTYAKVDDFGNATDGNSETTYYDANGGVLGYAHTNSYEYQDASGATVKNSSINFSSADWQPLGGSWTDEFGTGSNIVEIIDNSDNSNDVDLTACRYDATAKEITFKGSIRVEKGSFTPKGESEPESTYEHYYKYGTGDATEGEHLGGKDSFNFGAETQLWGANWTAGARAADVSKLKGDKALKATDLSNLPSDFINTALDSASVAYSEVTLTVAWDASNEVFTFTGADGKAATFTAINEGDTVIFDQTGLGSNDPVLKFSTDAAGTTAPTSGITEATGKTTVSFANNSGASVAGSSTDLYIYAEAKSDSSVVGTPVAVDVQDTKTVYGSTETFPWGGSETTYYVNGQVIGFSESHSDAGAAGTPAAGGYSSSNETYFDKDHNRIGDSYDDGQGNSGSNFRVKLTAAVDIDGDGTDDFGAGTATATYFQETGSSSWSYQDANGQTVSQTSEYTTYYAVSSSDSNEPDWSKMLGGRDVYDGIETLWGANWTHLGQKSSVNIADAVSQGTAGYSEVTDFTGLPASFKAAAGKTYAKVDDFGNATDGNSETTYYDANGGVLGYAHTNSYEYQDASGATVKNSSINFSSADWQPLGGSWTDEFGTGSNIVEIIDNSDNSNDVDLMVMLIRTMRRKSPSRGRSVSRRVALRLRVRVSRRVLMSIIISMGQGMLQKVSTLVVRTALTLELRPSFGERTGQLVREQQM